MINEILHTDTTVSVCDIDLLKSQVNAKIYLPDEARAVRYLVQLHGENVYISVVLQDGKPIEVFANTPPEWRHNIERMSFIESLNRVVSISLRCGVSVNEITRQLEKGSEAGQYPALLAGVLTREV